MAMTQDDKHAQTQVKLLLSNSGAAPDPPSYPCLYKLAAQVCNGKLPLIVNAELGRQLAHMGLSPPKQSQPGPRCRWLWALRLGLLAIPLWLVMDSTGGRLGIRPWGGNLRQGHLQHPRGRHLGEDAALHLQPPQQLYLSAQQRCQAPRKAERLPVLDQVGTWPAFSPVDPQHVTLVTQLNLERLDMLENQCKVWPHALAAAVYVPLLDGLVASLDSPELNGIRLAQALEVLGSFHARLQSEGACNLELALFAERCTDQGMAGLYPFNAMRNKALQMVQTEVVFQLDVDFLVNKEFGEEVGSPAGWAALRQQLALAPALVLPAFEPNATQLQMRPTSKQHAEHGDEVLEKQLQLGKAMALEAVEAGKGWVVAKYAARELQQFAIVKFEAGHNCTQYSRWLQAQDFYEINYTNGYEPYTLMLRKHIPWFDERFRGYGFDKMTGYLVMWHWGIRFAVHPRAFVVHVPHPVAKTLALTKRLNNYVKLRQMFIDALKDLLQHQYFPVTSFPERCPLRPGVQQQLSVEVSPGLGVDT